MPTYKPARLRRMAAFLIDFYGSISLAVILGFSLVLLLPAGGIFPSMLCIVCGIGYLYSRDWLMGGRSIGKRLCGLSVVDRITNAPASGKQLLWKNLCFLILPFDAFILLLTGRSVGERISDTVVIPEKRPAPLVKKRVLKFLAVAAVLALIVSFAVGYGLNQSKKNESYALSLAYLTESEAFTSQERENARITLTGFSSYGSTTRTHEYTFETRRHFYTVTCHLQPDGTWAVCTDCTEFD